MPVCASELSVSSHFKTLLVNICTANSRTYKFFFVPTERIYVLYGTSNKERLFPYTTLTGWFL
jgi:hypothetical protein